MRIMQNRALKLAIVVSSCLSSSVALAANDLGGASDVGIPALEFSSVIADVVRVMGIIAGVLSVLFLVIGGIKYATSQGDPKGLSSAKSTITYAIAGLLVSILAQGIVAFIVSRAPH